MKNDTSASRKRCGLCDTVTKESDLLFYNGICFFCNLDTNPSEETEFVRSHFFKVPNSGFAPQVLHEKRVRELQRRRAKREELWGFKY